MDCSYGLLSLYQVDNPISTAEWIYLPFYPGSHYIGIQDGATVGAYPSCFYHHVGTYKFFMVNKNILDESTFRSFQQTCQCSSIQFGTVAEVLDRNSLEIMDPPDFEYPSVEDIQIQQTVKEELGTIEASSIQVSSQNGRGLTVKAEGEVFGNNNLSIADTWQDPPENENEESFVDAGSKDKETIYKSGQKISFQQGLEESFNVQKPSLSWTNESVGGTEAPEGQATEAPEGQALIEEALKDW